MFAIKLEDGWARKDPLEGWVGSYLNTPQDYFPTRQAAEEVRIAHYADGYGKVEVVEIPDLEWIIQEFINPGPGPGYWYECRRVWAPTSEAARKVAFPEGKPAGKRLVPA